MFCEERDRLTGIYFEAIKRVVETRKEIGDSAEQMQAADQARAACLEVIEGLRKHTREHGC